MGVRELVRRIARYGPVREAIARVILREDETVPFGRELAFSTRSWVLKETEYGFRIWVALGERSISREIMLDRYERDEAAFVRTVVRSGDRVVDIGANIGFYTALLAVLVGPSGRVVACEPLETAADALERTMAENGFQDRIELLRVAVDAQRGTALLRHAPVTVNLGAAYLAPAAATPPGHVDHSVPTRTLDEIVGEGPCTFVKVDAEGAEPRILAGAERTLERIRPVMLVELNPTLLERVGACSANDVILRMAAHGYVARRLRDGSAGEVVERYDDAATINLIFEPRT